MENLYGSINLSDSGTHITSLEEDKMGYSISCIISTLMNWTKGHQTVYITGMSFFIVFLLYQHNLSIKLNVWMMLEVYMKSIRWEIWCYKSGASN